MGLLDNNPARVVVVDGNTPRMKTLVSLNDFVIKEVVPTSKEESMSLSAVWHNVAVFGKTNALYISTNGIDGDVIKVEFNNMNFPNLISGSTIQRIAIVPYARRTSASNSISYNGKNWRLVVFTTHGQIYHNFPSRANGFDGVEQSGDMTKFDESVVWDLPERMFPVKTETGDDAALIATGKYRYMPCLPDHMYEMHPGLNEDNGYGNGGFAAVRIYTDSFTKEETKRARYFTPVRGVYEGDSFNWISGLMQDSRMTVIGTYLNAYTYNVRIIVLTTNDGREWFVQYEYGCMGEIIGESENGTVKIQNPWNTSSEYGDTSNRIHFGTNTMSDSTAFILKKRSQYAPNDYNKEPEKTHKFKYGESVVISNIVSDSENGIVVTTSTNHGLVNGDIIVIEKNNGNSSWNWLCSEGHTDMSAGNGVVWKIKKLSDTTFRLNLEVRNPYNNLVVRHIHAINRVKDGYMIGCGEEYPCGWIEFMQVIGGDSFDVTTFAGNTFPIIRLTSTRTAVQRTLGVQMRHEGPDSVCYFGLDTATIASNDVVLPAGRTTQFYRNSLGIYKGKLEDIDNISKCECIYNTTQPAYFFKEIDGIFVFVGMRGELALSNDYGKSWSTFQLPASLYAASWLLGVTDKKEICIKYYGNSMYGSALVIQCKN